jgi:hypothetical protein
MVVKLKNNASTTIPNVVESSATEITVAANTGSVFPSLTAGDYFYATIASVENDYEVVKVTARSGDVLTVVRAQEGTLALLFPRNSQIALRVTVQNLQSIVDDLNFLLL